MTLTDHDRIKAAFAALRKQGFFARMNFWCCQSCAWADVPEGKPNVAFYHKQDAEAFDRWGNISPKRGGVLHIAHAGNSQIIVDALRATGLAVTWDGTDATRIEVRTAPPPPPPTPLPLTVANSNGVM